VGIIYFLIKRVLSVQIYVQRVIVMVTVLRALLGIISVTVFAFLVQMAALLVQMIRIAIHAFLLTILALTQTVGNA
jgi:hypothetical protein